MKLTWIEFIISVFLFVLIILAFLGLMWFVWIICKDLYTDIRDMFLLRYEEHPAVVKVTSKRHRNSRYIGRFYCSEEFNVYFVYKGQKYCIDDYDMFHHLKVGNMVNVIVHEGYNLKGQVKNIYFTLE